MIRPDATRRRLLVLGAVVVVVGALCVRLVLAATAAPSQSPLRVSVNKVGLLAGDGTPLRLIGVNRSGTEYACAQGWGIFDGPVGPKAIAAIASWGANAVRVPLNEDCWLGVNVPPTYSGARYRSAVERFVAGLDAAGLYAILELQWGAAGDEPALGQEAMPDADHATAFWTSVAAAFRHDPAVIFELFNEPHGVSWRCWEWGCTMPGGWRAVGMQQLLDTVRAAGAGQPVIVDGLDWANDLAGMQAHLPADPDHQLVVGFHTYPGNPCSSVSCWDAMVLPLTHRVPVVATEFGENDCRGSFATGFLAWAQSHELSSLAWTWDTDEGCRALITSYTAGHPTTYGAAVRAAFLRAAVPSTSRG